MVEAGAAETLKPERLRAWWAYKQALDGSLQGSGTAEVLSRTGWVRSVGGATLYLTLYARAGTGRREAEEAVAHREILELPAARGCTYVVPGSDAALAVTLASAAAGDKEMRVARTLGVTDAEVERLCDAVETALRSGPADPDAIRATVGGAVRSLGPAGVKKGLSSTLPLALGKLQDAGRILRIPARGRLDEQRYQYVRWEPSPLEGFHRSAEECAVELARRYFQWTGPATTAHFQWFSGLGVKAAKQAIASLGLEPVARGSDLLLLPEDREGFEQFLPGKTPLCTAVSSLDGIVLLRRDASALLSQSDLAKEWPGGESAGGAALGGLGDLPHHAILDRGTLTGFWEYDPSAGEVVWRSWAGDRRKVSELMERVQPFVKNELGDARAYSLDSEKKRAPRLAALRERGAAQVRARVNENNR
jgi:hypothetical protein